MIANFTRMAIWLAVVNAIWFGVTHDQLAAALGDQAGDRALAGATLAGLAGRFVAQWIEAGFYVLAGRLLGARPRLLPLFGWILTLSLCDALAASLFQVVGGDPPQPWLALLVGFRAFPEALAGEPGMRLAFGGLGLLALARVLGTAHALRQQGVAPPAAVGVTLAATGVGRIVTWWSTDLVRGMSPLP